VSTSSRMDTSALSKLYLYVVKWVHIHTPPHLRLCCVFACCQARPRRACVGTPVSLTIHTQRLFSLAFVALSCASVERGRLTAEAPSGSRRREARLAGARTVFSAWSGLSVLACLLGWGVLG